MILVQLFIYAPSYTGAPRGSQHCCPVAKSTSPTGSPHLPTADLEELCLRDERMYRTSLYLHINQKKTLILPYVFATTSAKRSIKITLVAITASRAWIKALKSNTWEIVRRMNFDYAKLEKELLINCGSWKGKLRVSGFIF